MALKPTYEELEQKITSLEKKAVLYKRLENALKDSERRYRSLFEQSNDAIIIHDLKGQIIDANSKASKMMGFKRKKFSSMTIPMIHPKNEFARSKQALKMTQKKGHTRFESQLKRSDGTCVEVEISSRVVDADRGIVQGVLRDITERKQAEYALQKSESRYRALFEKANDAIFIMKEDTFLECNQKGLEMFGCTREQIIGQSPCKFSPLHQPDRRDSTEKALEKIATALDGEPDVFEWRHTRLNGEAFDTEVSLSCFEIESEKFIQAIVRDISERKRLDKKLRLMQRWIEQSVDFFFWVGEDSRILYVNKAVCDYLGYTKEEFKSMKVGDFDLDVTLEAWPGFTQKVREQGSYHFESRLRKKNGQVFPVEITANILNFEGKDHFFAYGRDISAKVRAEEKRKELENRLRQAQKMEAIGTLAGGIAHDFNNILSVILGYTELCLDDINKSSPIYSNLHEVFRAGKRAKDLIRQILTFSRQTKHELRPVQVKTIIKETLGFLSASLPSTIEIHQDLKSDSIVMADPTQIHQIVMNLCTNAGHAMTEKGGILRVDLANIELDAGFTAGNTDLTLGPYLKITVSDTGHGISSKVLNRIFDPFFTTKTREEGTGMGLSVIHGIVKDHGGTITVSSELGKGSVFCVFLPVVEKRMVLGTKIDKAVPQGSESILFVDDEPSLVEIGKRMVESLGYEVVTRNCSIEALELFKAQPDRFDLVITDMTMPKMNGFELAEKLLQIKSDIPIILCTGFSTMIDEEKRRIIGIKEFIYKPILKRDIAEAIKKVLV